MFKRKRCDICGEKIGMSEGNRQGNVCNECAERNKHFQMIGAVLRQMI